MNIDHFVVNIDNDRGLLDTLKINCRRAGYPFKPEWGKQTKGFKVCNIWIGNTYFELVFLKSRDGGGWLSDWVTKYNEGHRGLIGIVFDVDDINGEYKRIKSNGIKITEPENLSFKWFFKLFTRVMPWKNSYVDYIPGTDIQIVFQQMDNEKARSFMSQYMVPNSRENGIDSIYEGELKGRFNTESVTYIERIFEKTKKTKDGIEVLLDNGKSFRFTDSDQEYELLLKAGCNNEKFINECLKIENIMVLNR